MKCDENHLLAQAFLQHTREAIAREHRRIAHSLAQLSDEQIWRRPTPHVNCIGNILLHLCGNLRQWFLHGIGGAEDIRERPLEFAETERVPKEQLLERFRVLIGQIDELLAQTSAETLLERRTIQGMEVDGLSAIYSTVNHLEGHCVQVSYITHMFVGQSYEPFWKPENEAQGAAAKQ